MKKIRTAELAEGIQFSQPVYIDEDNIFLQANMPLKQKEIDRLQRWEITSVLTNGDIIKDTPVAVTDKAAPKAYTLSNTQGINLYRSAVSRMENIIRDYMKNQKIEHDRIDSVVNDILTAVEQDQSNIIQLILLSGESSLRLSDSSVKTGILSTIIGKNLKMLPFRLMQLTTGALLHDIGMIKIPGEIRLKKGKLTPEELKQVRAHPIYGYRVILRDLQYPEEVAAIALLHQEKWDGSGYPRRLKGEEIPIGARVVAVADSFEAMVNKRSYRVGMIGYQAMKAILSDNGRHFDPKIVRALIMSMGIYPIGSLVLLNNSSIGKVVEIHSEAPLRPKLQLIIDEYGDRLLEPVFTDLFETKGLFIAKAVEPEVVERMEDEQ